MGFRPLVFIVTFSIGSLASLASPVQASKDKLQVSLQVEPLEIIQVGQKVIIRGICTDTHGENVTFSFTQGSMEGPKNAGDTWERTFNTAGEFRVTVTAQTPSGRTGYDATSIIVRGENLPPRVRLSVDKPVASRGEPVTFTAHGEDPEKWSLRYQFTRNGTILQEGHKHHFTETYSGLGEQTLEVRALDHEGAFATDQAKVVVVNQPPRLVIGGPSGGARNQPLPLEITALDPDNDKVAILYQVEGQKDWKPWQGQVQFSEPGSHTINFQGHDSHGAKSPITPYRVSIVNAPPSLELLPQATTVSRNRPLQIAIAVADSDKDRVSVTTSHPNVVITPESVSFTSDQLGAHTIEITASDPYGGTVTKSLDLEVINQSPNGRLVTPQNIERNQPTMLTVEASDPDNDDMFYSFSINGGDWTEYLPHNSQLIDFSDPGKYPIAARVRDQHGGMVEFSDVVSVVNTPPQITALNLPSQTYRGQGLQLTVKASDAENDPLEYAYSVNGQPPIKSPYPSFVFRADDMTPIEVEVTVTDKWGDKSKKTAKIEVTNRKPRIVLSAVPADWRGNIHIRSWVEDPDGDATETTLRSSHGRIVAQGPGHWVLQTNYPQEVFLQGQVRDIHGGETTESLRLVTNRLSLTQLPAITLSGSLYPQYEWKSAKTTHPLYSALALHFQTHSWRFRPPHPHLSVKFSYILKQRRYPHTQKEIPFSWQNGKWQQYQGDPAPKQLEPTHIELALADLLKGHDLKPHKAKSSNSNAFLPPGGWQKYKITNP